MTAAAIAPSTAPRSRGGAVLVAATTVAFFALYAFLGLRRLHGFAPRSIDLGFYIQMARSIAHGFSPMPLADGAHPLTLHVMPVLFPVAVVGRMAPMGDVIVIAHALAISLALPAAYRFGGVRAVALALFCPALSAQANFDVHPDCWAFAPMFMAFANEREGRGSRALGWWLVAFLCRETIPIFALAAAATHVRRDRSYALRLVALALAWLAFCIVLIFATGTGPLASLRAHAGADGGGGMLARVVSARTGVALFAWLAAGGLVAVLSPARAAPAAVVFALNAASAVPTALWTTSHYAALAFPFLLAATTESLERPRASAAVRTPLAVIAFASVGAMYVLSGDGPLSRRFVWDERPAAHVREAYTSLTANIPSGARVAATLPLQASLAARALVQRDDAPRAGVDVVLLVPTARDAHPELYRRHIRAWLAADRALAPVLRIASAVRLERGGDREDFARRQGWTREHAAPGRLEVSGETACVRFDVPSAETPPGDFGVGVRLVTGSVSIAFPGEGLWVPEMSTTDGFVGVRACAPAGLIAPGAVTWRWVTIERGRPRAAGPWRDSPP